jgi:hypothetical protein
MTFAVTGSRGLTAFAACLALVGCMETAGREDGLFYRPPTSTGQDFIATTMTPSEVAEVLGSARLGTVRSDTNSVTLVSNDLRLVDCGTMIQVAFGNRAEFPASAPSAVLMSGFAPPGLYQREVTSASTVRLSRQADGKGYAVAESHKVTRKYEAVDFNGRSSASVSFDETSVGQFANSTSCRSSGLVGTLLR